MADSSTDLAASTDQEMVTVDQTEDVSVSEEAESKAAEPAESKEAMIDESANVEDDSSKANNEVEEEEEYVLKDEAHEEEDNQKEPETNGKEHEGEGKDQKEEEKEKKTEDTEKTEEKPSDKSLGSTVAKHYNNIPEKGRDVRRQSRIFHLRNFNNWVKSVVINEFLEKVKQTRRRYDEEINVLDLGCGKGGDLLKWQKGRVGHVICADIAETSVQQCRERYNNMKKSQRQGGYRERERLFSIECFPADCTKVDISKKFRTSRIQLDLTSCQFAFHYSFESYEQADMMLKNACEHLRPGGYFIGTTPDANELVKHLKKAEGKSFGNDVYNIEFDSKDHFPLFGTKYHFNLVDVVDCPEFLVHFKTVEKLAEKYNMKLVYKKNFKELFNENYKDYGSLLHKMQALESYPARRGWNLVSDKESDYAHIQEHEKEVHSGREKVLGTMTKDEWDAAGLYVAFAFEKIDPAETAKQEQKEKAAKRAAPSEHKEEDCEPPVKRSKDVKEDADEKDSKAENGDVKEGEAEGIDDKESKVEDSGEKDKTEESQTETQEDAEKPSDDTEMVESIDTPQQDTSENQPSSDEQVPAAEPAAAEESTEQPQEEQMEEDEPTEQTEDQASEQTDEQAAE